MRALFLLNVKQHDTACNLYLISGLMAITKLGSEQTNKWLFSLTA
jgi:hypothetical protein